MAIRQAVGTPRGKPLRQTTSVEAYVSHTISESFGSGWRVRFPDQLRLNVLVPRFPTVAVTGGLSWTGLYTGSGDFALGSQTAPVKSVDWK